MGRDYISHAIQHRAQLQAYPLSLEEIEDLLAIVRTSENPFERNSIHIRLAQAIDPCLTPSDYDEIEGNLDEMFRLFRQEELLIKPTASFLYTLLTRMENA